MDASTAPHSTPLWGYGTLKKECVCTNLLSMWCFCLLWILYLHKQNKKKLQTHTNIQTQTYRASVQCSIFTWWQVYCIRIFWPMCSHMECTGVCVFLIHAQVCVYVKLSACFCFWCGCVKTRLRRLQECMFCWCLINALIVEQYTNKSTHAHK